MSVAFVYPGQGSQYVGMARALRERSAVARETFDEAEATLNLPIGRFADEGPEEDLTATEHLQPTLLTLSVAWTRALLQAGFPAPFAAAGHSLGEYAALVAADCLDFPDALRLVRLRGWLMQEAVPAGVGAMAALRGASPEQASAWCAAQPELVELAAVNCPGQVSVAGLRAGVEAVLAQAEREGFHQSVMLKVSAPFHCSLLRPAAEGLATALAALDLRMPRLFVPQNVDARAPVDLDELRVKLSDQVCRPVLWEACARALLAAGVTRFVELGPGSTIAGLLRKLDRKLDVVSIDRTGAFDALLGGIH